MAKKKLELNCANIQGIYATLLKRFTMASMIFLAISFAIYIFQWIPSYIDIDKMGELIRLRSADYRVAANGPTGWAWLNLIGYSDYLSFMAIAFISGVSVFVYFILVHVFWRCKDYIYTSIAVIQILIFLLAASGIVNSGH